MCLTGAFKRPIMPRMHSTEAGTMNREQWLEAAVNELRPLFKRAGFTIPKVYVSVGWPISGGRKRSGPTIGQAWSPENSEDKTGHVFISPVLSDPVRVLDVLVHELGHIVVGVKHGHRAPFVRFCKAVGLEGKPTATTASDALKETLTEVLEKIGDYPHGALAPGEGKKQTTRLLKVVCPDCGYTIRVTQKWVDEGYPTCPCGSYMCDPDMVDGTDTLKQADSTIGYSAHGGRFEVRYFKSVINGRIREQKWTVIDYEAHAIRASVINTQQEFVVLNEGQPEWTILPTRDDVLGFIEAVLQGVYKYDTPEIIDVPDDGDVDWDDDDQRDYLLPDEVENPDAEDFSDDEWLRECERQVRASFPAWDDAKVYAEVNKRAQDAYPKQRKSEPVEILPDAAG